MSKRIDPVNQVVTFFENAPVETAVIVLAIVKGIVARRAPKTKAPKPPKAAAKAAPQPNGAVDQASGS